jgi:putative FmdB family regulatory protein
MPSYDFRCKVCVTEFTLTYKSYKNYEQATPECPNCQSVELSRIIRKINIEAPTRDYSKMSSAEMLSVFSSGDSKQVGQMFNQVTGTNPALASEYHETTQRLMRGESMDKVEKHLTERDSETKAKPKKEPKSKPKSEKSS